jgi:hypothetical protein
MINASHTPRPNPVFVHSATGKSARKMALQTASYIPFFILKDKPALVKPIREKISVGFFGRFPDLYTKLYRNIADLCARTHPHVGAE